MTALLKPRTAAELHIDRDNEVAYIDFPPSATAEGEIEKLVAEAKAQGVAFDPNDFDCWEPTAVGGDRLHGFFLHEEVVPHQRVHETL